MPNMTGGNKVLMTPWDDQRALRIPFEIPGISTIYYPGQGLLRDANGNAFQCDDTAKGEFIGIYMDVVRPQVDPTDTIQTNGVLGDKLAIDIYQPLMFEAMIAAAAAGDEGRSVYWLYNNQVQYSVGVNGNYAGKVWYVKDSTHVLVTPPWVYSLFKAAYQSSMTVPTTLTSLALTKWDVNRTFKLNPLSGALTTLLPPITNTSPGDRISFIYIGAGAVVCTISGGSININGSTTTTVGTAQYSHITVESDGVQWWLV